MVSELLLRRLMLGLRQGAVAKEAGLCRTVLSDYERGVRKPKPEVVMKILDAIERLADKRG